MWGSGSPPGTAAQRWSLGARERRFESCHPDLTHDDVGTR